MSITPGMRWRYATKKFDPQKKLSSEALNDLLEAVRLAPSSFGLQPYRFILVEDKAVREKIRGAAANQPQVTDGSHLIVIAAEINVGKETVARFVDNAAETRGVARETLSAREDFINQSVGKLPADSRISWAQKQAYLALGILISAATEAGIDACPMEGFDPIQINEILDLEEQSLTATAFAVLGYRAADDGAAALAKVRKPFEALFTTV